jgi:hypothetical protein
VSWPYKLSAPPSISQQAQHIGAQLATWAEPKGGEVRIMANMRHLWEHIMMASDKPRLLVCFTGEVSRGGEDLRYLHRVDRSWSVVVIRGHGFDLDPTAEGATNTGTPVDAFYDNVETVRDLIRVITSISEEFPVEYKAIKPVAGAAPTPASNVFMDAYEITFTTANDIGAISLT